MPPQILENLNWPASCCSPSYVPDGGYQRAILSNVWQLSRRLSPRAESLQRMLLVPQKRRSDQTPDLRLNDSGASCGGSCADDLELDHDYHDDSAPASS